MRGRQGARRRFNSWELARAVPTQRAHSHPLALTDTHFVRGLSTGALRRVQETLLTPLLSLLQQGWRLAGVSATAVHSPHITGCAVNLRDRARAHLPRATPVHPRGSKHVRRWGISCLGQAWYINP